ncbi:hypothetical protein [Vibrio phage BUCT194]|uniref:Uncharacterized protein n=1 Tax=Vibrio phage BUCT194 TaxID=2859072 RepID=A0AAE8XFV1_9CAUD|nr:hypothetical protein PP741_gp047 [Vibrio phage BUCT194]UAW01178.1 hypothetical protein [Vibrio phage BUCT194]
MKLIQIYAACEDEGKFYTVHAIDINTHHIDWFPYRKYKDVRLYKGECEDFSEPQWRPVSQSDNSGVTTE